MRRDAESGRRRAPIGVEEPVLRTASGRAAPTGAEAAHG